MSSGERLVAEIRKHVLREWSNNLVTVRVYGFTIKKPLLRCISAKAGSKDYD